MLITNPDIFEKRLQLPSRAIADQESGNINGFRVNGKQCIMVRNRQDGYPYFNFSLFVLFLKIS